MVVGSLTGDPLGAYRFIIEIEGSGPTVTAAFARFSGVKMQVETVKVRTGADERGVLREIPALTTFGNVKFSKGVIGDSEFLEWILSAAPNAVSAATGVSMRRTINVTAIDRNGRSAVRWTLYEAMPVQY
ncbi:MAG: phage tail protein, partial [Oscillospiraceae bacterium]|nr:phage tail protein [Oscillospiraceae bacterium]